MKSQRRHELQTNMLADWLGDVLDRIRPYQNVILGVAILALAGVVGLTILSHRRASYAGQAWDSMGSLLATNPADFEKTIKLYPNTPAAQWSRVLTGDMYLANGVNELFSSKPIGLEQLGRAQEQYLAALNADTKKGWIAERAAFGLARTMEAAGKLDEAARRYDEIVQQWPNGMFKEEAASRSKELQKQSVKWFYDQFAAYNPQPPAPVKEPALPQSREHIGQPAENPPAETDLKYHSPFSKYSEQPEKTKPAAKAAPGTEKAKPGVEKPGKGGEKSKPAPEKPKTDAAKPAKGKP
jgi:hypothetical protein